MVTSAAPDRPDITLRLAADAYYHLVSTLCLALPPPPSDHPDDLTRRNHAAVARIAALVPVNAAEADLAAMFVAASEQWKDCLRLAQRPETTPEMPAKRRAQAIGMMREAQGALRLLLKLQEARRKRDADPAACTSAEWMEHCAIRLMAEALSPAVAQAPSAEPQAPPMPEPQPEPAAAPEFAFAEEEIELDPACPGPRSGVAEAEHYAVLYPERAALIRRLGRVPADVSFGPPDPDIVQALVTARTPALAALDREYAQARTA